MKHLESYYMPLNFIEQAIKNNTPPFLFLLETASFFFQPAFFVLPVENMQIK